MDSNSLPATYTPAINPTNHGPKVILAGGIMTGPLILMLTLAFYVRSKAGTMFHPDGVLLLIGATFDVSVFAIFNILTHHGFGRREDSLSRNSSRFLRKLLLGGFMLLFISHGVTKIAYNVLARRTIRSSKFKIQLDIFNLFVGLWTLANLLVATITMAKSTAPPRGILMSSGVISIAIMISQFVVWMSIIWRTNTQLGAKIQWTLSIGAFLPLSIAATICRIIYTPSDFFGPDWTFQDAEICALFLIELNLATMNVLAPNLPTFFKKTSIGGWFFLPGEAIDAAAWKKLRKASLPQNRPVPRHLDDVHKGNSRGVGTTISQAEERDPSLVREIDDSAITVRHSIEIRISPTVSHSL